MGGSRSTNEGGNLFVASLIRGYTEFVSNFVEDEAHKYSVLIANVEQSKRHLDKEVLVSTNDLARYIDIGGE